MGDSMTGLQDAVRKLTEILERFRKGERRGLVLTLAAMLRLSEKGKKTPSTCDVVEEAREILKKTDGKSEWGVSLDEYTEEKAIELLEELREMGILDIEGPRRYRFARYDSRDIEPYVRDHMAPILLRLRT